MDKPKLICKILVGSRLHGLHTPDSDYDYRGVYINSLRDILSPFEKVKTTSWVEGGAVDDVTYELAHFCKSATSGSPTSLEILFSNQIVNTSPTAEKLRANWDKLFDTDQFVIASRQYAHSQYNKMQLFEPDDRTPKFAVAYVRVLWQCAEFLKTGVFPCQIDEPYVKDFLMEVKNSFNISYVPKLTEMFMEMQKRVTDAYQDTQFRYKPDTEWIESFIYDAYTTEYQDED